MVVKPKSSVNPTLSLVPRKKAVSKSKKSGLLFPVARVLKLMKSPRSLRTRRISVCSGVYLTAVLEYLASELIDLAGTVAKAAKRKTLTPRFLMLAVHNDDELLKVLPKVTFPFSGSVPNIYPSLMPKTRSIKNSAPVKSCNPRKSEKVLNRVTLLNGQTLCVLQTDISNLTVDAVVNPTNSTFYMGGMVGTSLMQAGGALFAEVMNEIRKEVGTLGLLDVYSSKGTGTKAKNIIHVNSPVWDSTNAAQKISGLTSCVEKCLQLAIKEGYQTIALPSIGSGKAKFPCALAAETIVGTIKRYLNQTVNGSLNEVMFVLFDQASIDAYVYELNRST